MVTELSHFYLNVAFLDFDLEVICENIVTLSNVNKLAESIQTKISKFGELLSTLQNMENKHVEQYGGPSLSKVDIMIS